MSEKGLGDHQLRHLDLRTPSLPLYLNLQAAGLSHFASFFGASDQSRRESYGNQGQCLPFRLELTEVVLRTPGCDKTFAQSASLFSISSRWSTLTWRPEL